MTAEQVELMQEHMLLDHPELAKKAEVYSDPGYDEAESKLAVTEDDRAEKARAEPELAPVDDI